MLWEEVIQAYIDNVYSEFGGSLKMLSDNGTEFKNKMFEQISRNLGYNTNFILHHITQPQIAE